MKIHTPDTLITYYGCRPWEPQYDLSLVPKARRLRICPVCRSAIRNGTNTYCEGCSAGTKAKPAKYLELKALRRGTKPVPVAPARKLSRRERRRLKFGGSHARSLAESHA